MNFLQKEDIFFRNFADMKIWNIILGICVASTFAIGCNNAETELTKPANLIEESTFTDMIAEQLIIESTIFYAPAEENKKEIANKFYEEWIEKYNVTPDIFQDNIDYYFGTEKSAEKIMNEVKEKIQAQEQNDH